MQVGLISIDNFYDDPDSVRNIALSTEYYEDKKSQGYKFGNAPWPGKMSKKPYSPDWVDAKISKLLNKNLRQMRQLDSGCFRISKEGTISANILHADSPNGSYYAAVLYLTKNKEDTPGTLFYKQKSTGSDQALNEEHLKSIVVNNEFNDLSKWVVHTVSNIVYNRLLIYPANKFHGIGPVFGDSDNTGRLVQLFNFIEIT
jgi:hypothetical protein